MHRRSILLIAALVSTAALPARTMSAQARPTPNPIARLVRASLRGITLTDAEKTSLAAVSARYAPQFKAVSASGTPIKEALRTARQAHDTAAARAARRQLRDVRQRGFATLRAAMTDLRAALAEEHRARFDRNVVQVRRAMRRRLAPALGQAGSGA